MAPRAIRPIRVEGNIAYVTLTKGHEAVIDAADAAMVAAYNWFAVTKRSGVYAARRGEQGRTVYLHRQLSGPPDGMLVDHINGVTLDNRRCNLRFATPSQNQHNQKRSRANRSGLKGAHWASSRKKWAATIAIGGKRVWLGYYETPEEAHMAYRSASLEVHGRFGRWA